MTKHAWKNKCIKYRWKTFARAAVVLLLQVLMGSRSYLPLTGAAGSTDSTTRLSCDTNERG